MIIFLCNFCTCVIKVEALGQKLHPMDPFNAQNPQTISPLTPPSSLASSNGLTDR